MKSYATKSYSLQQACALGNPIGHYEPLTKGHIRFNKVLWYCASIFGIRLSFAWIALERKPPTYIDIRACDVSEADYTTEEKAFVEQPLAQLESEQQSGNSRHYLELAKKWQSKQT